MATQDFVGNLRIHGEGLAETSLALATNQKRNRSNTPTMKSVVALFFGLMAGASAIELTPDNWDDAVAGKTIFVKFLAPW